MPLQREEGAKTITRTFEHKFDGKKLITKHLAIRLNLNFLARELLKQTMIKSMAEIRAIHGLNYSSAKQNVDFSNIFGSTD